MNRNKLIRHSQLAEKIVERHNPPYALEIDGELRRDFGARTRDAAREKGRGVKESTGIPCVIRVVKRHDDGSGYEVVR